MSAWPSNVGILAIELVCPKQFVSQSELEIFDKVPAGKYTIGLGQDKMGFCTDREDINSLCLTVVERLIRRQPFGYEKIGRLEVGTETILDKSKSVKTVLMQLFEESGNTDVEGIDTTNACYGGTAALFNALAWVESSAWDGRLALVVAGDIAVYAQGSARPTGGAGAIAMLVGPNASLVVERGARATHMRHVYDFYKPNLSSEYPTVDGKLSIQCYLSALDKCYQLYCKKVRDLGSQKSGAGGNVTLEHFDAILFHSPYCKLVQKSLARLLLNDFMCSPESKSNEYPGLEQYRNTKLEDTYFDRDIEKVAMLLSKEIFETKTKPSLYLANQVGNMYTPSLYGGLVSWLISKSAADMAGKRLGLFSYGSGFASSMYSLRVTDKCGAGSPLAELVQSLAETKQTLALRTEYTPDDFSKIMEAREKSHHRAPYQPTFDVDHLFPDVWFLDSVDDKHRRYYKKSSSPAESILVNSSAFNHK